MGYKLLSYAATAGNVAATFVVPAGKDYRVLYGETSLTTDATVASRRVEIQVLDASDVVLFRVPAGATVAASLSGQRHGFMPGVPRETAAVAGSLLVPVGQDLVLPPGYKLRVRVDAGVAGDSHVGYFMVEEK